MMMKTNEKPILITPAALGYEDTTLEGVSSSKGHARVSAESNTTGANPAAEGEESGSVGSLDDVKHTKDDNIMNLSFFHKQQEPRPPPPTTSRQGRIPLATKTEEEKLSWQGLRVREALQRSASLKNLETFAGTKSMDVSSCSHLAVSAPKTGTSGPSLSPPPSNKRGELKSDYAQTSLTNLSLQMTEVKKGMIPKSASANSFTALTNKTSSVLGGDRPACTNRKLPSTRDVTRRSLTSTAANSSSCKGSGKFMGNTPSTTSSSRSGLMKAVPNKLKETWDKLTHQNNTNVSLVTGATDSETATVTATKNDASSLLSNDWSQLGESVASLQLGDEQATKVIQNVAAAAMVAVTPTKKQTVTASTNTAARNGTKTDLAVTSSTKPASKRDLLTKESGGISTLADEIAQTDALEALEAANARKSSKRQPNRRSAKKERRVSGNDIEAARKMNSERRDHHHQQQQPRKDPQRRVIRRLSATATMSLRDAPTTRAVPAPTASSKSRKKRSSSATRLMKKQPSAPSLKVNASPADAPSIISTAVQNRRIKRSIKRSVSHDVYKLGPPPGDCKVRVPRETVRRSSSHDNQDITKTFVVVDDTKKPVTSANTKPPKRRQSGQKLQLKKASSQKSLGLAPNKTKVTVEEAAAAEGKASNNTVLTASCHAELGVTRKSKPLNDPNVDAPSTAAAATKKKRPPMKKSKSSSAILIKPPPQSRPRRVSARSKKEAIITKMAAVGVGAKADKEPIRDEDFWAQMELYHLVRNSRKMEFPSKNAASEASKEKPSACENDDFISLPKDEQQSVASSVEVPPRLCVDELVQEILEKGKPELITSSAKKASLGLGSTLQASQSNHEEQVQNAAMMAVAEAQSLMTSLDALTKALIP